MRKVFLIAVTLSVPFFTLSGITRNIRNGIVAFSAVTGISIAYSLNNYRAELSRLERKKKRISRALRRYFPEIPKKRLLSDQWLDGINASDLPEIPQKLIRKYEELLEQVHVINTAINRCYWLLLGSLATGVGAVGWREYERHRPHTLEELASMSSDDFRDTYLSFEERRQANVLRNLRIIEENLHLSADPHPSTNTLLTRELPMVERAFNSATTTEIENAKTCGICLDDISDNCWITKNCGCKACYHGRCALALLKSHSGNRCPMCRSSLLR